MSSPHTIFNNHLISCESSFFSRRLIVVIYAKGKCYWSIQLHFYIGAALHGYFTSPEINWPLYVAIPTLPLPLRKHCKETGLFLMRQLLYLPQTNSKRHQKYWVPHNLHSTLQEYMYRIESPSPRTTKYKNSKKQSLQKSNASATSRPDSQRPAELLIRTPFSAWVEPWTAMNNDPTNT